MAKVGLAAFVAIWVIFVVPAERRHHERKMVLVRKKIERHAERSAVVDGAETEDKSNNSG